MKINYSVVAYAQDLFEDTYKDESYPEDATTIACWLSYAAGSLGFNIPEYIGLLNTLEAKGFDEPTLNDVTLQPHEFSTKFKAMKRALR